MTSLTSLTSFVLAATLGRGPAAPRDSIAPPESLLAEAPILGSSTVNSVTYIPITIAGKAATVVADWNDATTEIALSADRLATVGATGADTAPTATITVGGHVMSGLALKHILDVNQVPEMLGQGPPNFPPVVGVVGLPFLRQFDLLYDWQGRRMRLYAIPATPVTATTGWLPPGFKPYCAPMVDIPLGPSNFTGVKIAIDGHPITGVIEMAPTYIKMNPAALAVLGLPDSSSRFVPITDDPSVAGTEITRDVTGVQVTWAGAVLPVNKIQLWPHVDVQLLLPPNTPVLLMNLNTVAGAQLYNAMSSKQVCLVPPDAAGAAAAASIPVTPGLPLTVALLRKMATFWTAFLQEPPAISVTGRQAHQEPLNLDIGASAPVQLAGVVNITALAAQFPAVAADLAKVHLTAAEWEAARAGLYAAVLAQQQHTTPAPSSLVAKNLAFLQAHPEALTAVQATGMWLPRVTQ